LSKNIILLLNNPIGTPFIELHKVDSTNNYAMGLAHEGMAQHGTAVFAHDQTNGKGQRNRQWVSSEGKNVALTLIIEPVQLINSRIFELSMCIAVGVNRFVKAYIGEDVKIKWPNDIYWRDRKAGGILIENVVQGKDWKYAIAGIGFNINQTDFPGLENKAVSLKQITGKHFEPAVLARELCKSLDEQFNKLIHEPKAVIDGYHDGLYKLNERVRLKQGSRIFEASVKEVTDLGQLIVEHAVEESFDVGEVEWIV
jgi:BirA family biotin operon repressor/biotin-[acetyl-CoA-carboxylase] ligase